MHTKPTFSELLELLRKEFLAMENTAADYGYCGEYESEFLEGIGRAEAAYRKVKDYGK